MPLNAATIAQLYHRRGGLPPTRPLRAHGSVAVRCSARAGSVKASHPRGLLSVVEHFRGVAAARGHKETNCSVGNTGGSVGNTGGSCRTGGKRR